jgi:hypothetical protein
MDNIVNPEKFRLLSTKNTGLLSGTGNVTTAIPLPYEASWELLLRVDLESNTNINIVDLLTISDGHGVPGEGFQIATNLTWLSPFSKNIPDPNIGGVQHLLGDAVSVIARISSFTSAFSLTYRVYGREV